MKNLWPEFKSVDRKPVRDLIEDQGKLLPSLTGDMVYAKIQPLSNMDAIMDDHKNDFAYAFLLAGKFLKNYSFKVFSFSYDITFYPVKIKLDRLIAEETGLPKEFSVSNEEQFESVFGRILTSERLKSIVGSIIKISGTHIATIRAETEPVEEQKGSASNN